METALRSLGTVPLLFPTISIVAPPKEDPIMAAIANLHTYDWLLFTSVNAVQSFFSYYRKAQSQGLSTGSPLKLPRIAVVGPVTARAVENLGESVYLMAETFQQEGLVEVFATLPHAQPQQEQPQQDQPHSKVLLPRALEARDILEKQLPHLGYRVDVLAVYQTVMAQPSTEQIQTALTADAIVFTSPSTVKGFVKIMENHESGSGITFLKSHDVFSIGPVTSAEIAHYLKELPLVLDLSDPGSDALKDRSFFEAPQSTADSVVATVARVYA